MSYVCLKIVITCVRNALCIDIHSFPTYFAITPQKIVLDSILFLYSKIQCNNNFYEYLFLNIYVDETQYQINNNLCSCMLLLLFVDEMGNLHTPTALRNQILLPFYHWDPVVIIDRLCFRMLLFCSFLRCPKIFL